MADGGRFQRDVADRSVVMFASFVGRGLHTTRAALSAASGVPESSLREYAGGAAMPVHVLLAIADHLPAAAINMITEPAGKRLIDAEKTDTNWDVLAAAAATLTSQVCEARADGVIDHVEDRQLKARGRVLAALLASAVEEG